MTSTPQPQAVWYSSGYACPQGSAYPGPQPAYGQYPVVGYSSGYGTTPGAAYPAAGQDAVVKAVKVQNDEENSNRDGTGTVNMSESNPFSDKNVRRGFIRKVFWILTSQFFMNVCFIASFLFIQPLREYAQENTWIISTSAIVSFSFLVGMVRCCKELLVKVPINFILLYTFTLFESICLGAISGQFKIEHVLMAMGITAVVTLSLSIFALQTKVDFTIMHGLLFTFLIVLLMFFFMMAILGTSNLRGTLFVSSIGALLFSVYLVVDVQMLTSGKEVSVSPEQYVMAVIKIHIDVIIIFINVLRMLKRTN